MTRRGINFKVPTLVVNYQFGSQFFFHYQCSVEMLKHSVCSLVTTSVGSKVFGGDRPHQCSNPRPARRLNATRVLHGWRDRTEMFQSSSSPKAERYISPGIGASKEGLSSNPRPARRLNATLVLTQYVEVVLFQSSSSPKAERYKPDTPVQFEGDKFQSSSSPKAERYLKVDLD